MTSKKRKQYDCIWGKTSTRKCLVPFSGNGVDICRLYETGQCCYDWLCAFEKDSQDAFEAGQQSERNKHRWIPVTERLPTEKDGDYDNEHNCVIVNVKFSDNSVSSAFCDLSEKYFECLRKPVSWQPLPEA